MLHTCYLFFSLETISRFTLKGMNVSHIDGSITCITAVSADTSKFKTSLFSSLNFEIRLIKPMLEAWMVTQNYHYHP
jgi:hypothetical protein